MKRRKGRKRGRKKLPVAEKLRVLSVRVRRDEAKHWKDLAAQEGIPLSVWVVKPRRESYPPPGNQESEA